LHARRDGRFWHELFVAVVSTQFSIRHHKNCPFVSDLQARDDCPAIARAIINLGSSLQMNIAAEGIETEEQLEFLVTAGCTELHGYPFSKLVPAGELPALIKQLSALQASALPGSPMIGLAVDL
jgi:predicted signal transduction protein with EAL and GGDEF domain